MERTRNARQRRAWNIIWTAAGDYGFRPEFMAFHRDGSPDIYLNSIVGLAHRHYDMERLSGYMHTFDDSLLRDLFMDLFWLGIEQAAYERELPARPALRELRREHAQSWMEEDVDVSMQQLMMRREVVHSMKQARCREILGEPTGLRNPWDRKLYDALRFSGDMGTDEILAAMEGLWRRFFLFRFRDLPRGKLHLLLGPRWTAFLRKWLPVQTVSGEENSPGMHPVPGESGAQCAGTAGSLPSAGKQPRKGTEFLERFGPPLFRQSRTEQAEREFCKGVHEGTRLWFAAGRGDAPKENTAWYAAHRAQCRTCIAQLRDHVRNCLAVYRQPMELPSRHGLLRPGRIWRAEHLGDTRIFSAWEEAAYGHLSLLLLLDASASRESQQAWIAGQAYAIAEGVRQAGIPIAIASFCSMQGYTILQRMKDFGDGDAKGAFRYAAQGWNRDGLALRAATELFRGVPGRKLVLVLTDAYPSDETGIGGRTFPITKAYMQEPAVEDTAKAVQELRRDGLEVIGIVNSVFPGSVIDGYARQIYGHKYARISRISQLAALVGNLLEEEIRGAKE